MDPTNKYIYTLYTLCTEMSIKCNSKNEIMNRKSTRAFKVIIMIKPSCVPTNFKKDPKQKCQLARKHAHNYFQGATMLDRSLPMKSRKVWLTLYIHTPALFRTSQTSSK